MFCDAGLAWDVPSYFMDVCFLLDIFVQFRTGFMKEGTLVMDPALIARRYIFSGWLFLDFLAGFPVLLVMRLATGQMGADDCGGGGSEGGQGEELLRLNQTTKLFRIVRVMRVLRIFRLVKLNRCDDATAVGSGTGISTGCAVHPLCH